MSAVLEFSVNCAFVVIVSSKELSLDMKISMSQLAIIVLCMMEDLL